MSKRPHKYGAQRTTYGGHTYDSKAEATRASELDLLVRVGEVYVWFRQVEIDLGPDFRTRVDFVVIANDGDGYLFPYVEEVKGVETPQFKTVRRLWPRYGRVPMKILKRRGSRWETEWIKVGAWAKREGMCNVKGRNDGDEDAATSSR